MPLSYVDVTKDVAGMKRMLEHSKGDRTVPVIVEGSTVTIGYNGEG
jgi:glutaredoxin